MTKRSETDVIVLGIGTCGEDLSLQLLDAGLEVVGVEAALVGGECPYWACIPSKRMIRNANLIAEARRADGVAGEVAVQPRWEMVAAQIRAEVTGGWSDSGAVERFEKRGGRLVKGSGRLSGERTVVVDDEVFVARRGVVLATGSQPHIPAIPGLVESGFWSSHDVIAAETLPQTLIVLGGGVVGCELGQLLARFGVDVTIVEAAARLLPAEEPEASAVLAEALEAEGLSVMLDSTVDRVEGSDAGGTVKLADGRELSAERILVATGRTVDLSQLGLESVGLDGSASAIETDDQMRAGRSLWAVGDVTGRAMLTHVALHQGTVAIADILDRPHPAARYDAVPRVAFTDPEVAAVGLTEAAARSAGLDPVVTVKRLEATFRGWLHRDGNVGLVKLVADRDQGRLLGATAVGPAGGEMLGMLSLAVHAHVPVDELRSMIYAFPTFHGAIGEAIGAYGRGVTTVLDPGYDGVARFDEISQT